MSSRLRNGKVLRALNYIIRRASNYFAQSNLAKYKEFMPQTKWKRWMLAGYISATLTLLSIALVNNEVRQYVFYPLLVILDIVVTKKVFEQLKPDTSNRQKK